MPTGDVADILIGVLNAGADSIQIRDTAASPAQAVALAHAIECGMPNARDRLVIHERLIGAETASSWRHVRSASIASQTAANDALFGASVHSSDAARRAVELGAGFVTFGHVYWTRSHPGEPPHGIAVLADVVDCVDVPVLAIGGITTGNLDRVLATGCAGIAVISAVLAQPDPVAATRQLRHLLDGSPSRPRHPLRIRAPFSQEGQR